MSEPNETEKAAENQKLVETTIAKVERFLRTMGPYEVLGNDCYRVREGSAHLLLRVCQFSNGKPFVRLLSFVLRDVKKAGNEAMFEEFSKLNDQWVFGKIYWSENAETPGVGYIMVEHSLLGEFLDFEELFAGIQVLILTADEIDDQLQTRYGGKRFVDP